METGSNSPIHGTSAAWLVLLAAGLLEIAWAASLKASNGLSRPWISVLTVVLMILSFGALAIALKSIPVGTGYAVWTGIGTIGVAIVGMIMYKEPASSARLLCIALIVAGIVGLKVLEGAAPADRSLPPASADPGP